MPFLVWKKEVMDAGRTADMSVLYQSRGCWLHRGWKSSRSRLVSGTDLPAHLTSPMSWSFWIICPGNPVVWAWSFQLYKSDLSPRLTLMLIPSLEYRAVNDVRDKCLQAELGWILWEAVAEVSGAEWMTRGKVSGMCSCRPESLCWSLFKIAS